MNDREQLPVTEPLARPLAGVAAPRLSRLAAVGSRARALVQITGASLVPYVRLQLQRAGAPGLAGLGLLVGGIAFFASTNSTLRTESVTLRTELARAERERDAGRLPAPPAVQVDALLGKLPRRTELPLILGLFAEEARAAGLDLERGTYDFTVGPSGRITRYRLNFPVTGHYPEVRHFIDNVLLKVPSAALDSLRLERKSVGDEAVTADLRFAVFVRNQP
jgi:hypothetical protein